MTSGFPPTDIGVHGRILNSRGVSPGFDIKAVLWLPSRSVKCLSVTN